LTRLLLDYDYFNKESCLLSKEIFFSSGSVLVSNE